MPSPRSSFLRSSKLLFCGAVAIFIALLLGAPVLRSAYSAGGESAVAKPSTGADDVRSMRTSGNLNAPGAVSAQTDESGKKRAYTNIDIRVNGRAALPKVARTSPAASVKLAQTQAVAIQKGLARLKADVPGLEAKISPLTGAVELLRSSGALTGAAAGRSGEDIVRGFLTDNSALYGLSGDEIDNLNFIGESVSHASGLRMVRVEQIVNGLPVFQSETRFILDREGRIIRSVGLIIPKATATATAPALDQSLSAQEALGHAMSTLDISVDVGQTYLTESNADGTRTEIVANNPQIAGNVPSKLVYFPVAPGVLIPAWSQIIFTIGDADWYTLVDANTGTLLWRKNIRNTVSTHDARFRVYVQPDGKTPADSPAPMSPSTVAPGSGTQAPAILPTIVSMLTAQDIVASPNGWINDCPGGICTVNETQTIGNNVHAYLDRQQGAAAGGANQPDTNAANVIDGGGKPLGNPDPNGRNRDFLGTTPRDFQGGFLPPPQGGNPEAGQTAGTTAASGNGNNGTNAFDSFRRGAITQLFYVCNWYHDQLFELGFDEAAGNFQQTNFSGMGVGNDRVLAEAQDGSSTNNANFSTPPDGTSGRAQMFVFTGPTIDRDGDLDADVLMHELTHGTSNRLIGNGAGLNWDVGGGMGEGWSDFVALSLLNGTNADDPNANYTEGGYVTYKAFGLPYLDNYVYGIRRFPYSTNNSVNPMTWADVDDVTNDLSGGIPPDPLGNNTGGAFEVHNIGEVWALTLWEVRSRIIADPAGANGDVPTGNHTMLQIVIDGMKMTPTNPTFIEARDALIDADCAANACANERSIWGGFADRGLGHKADAPLAQMFGFLAGHMGIHESFLIPDLDVQTVTVDDSLGNNNGAIDPGEPIKLTVKLTNPWRNAAQGVASATATLSSSTPEATIIDGNSSYPAIPAQGNADGDTFLFTVSTSAACGQSLKFTLTPNSTLGSTTTREIVLRVGAPSGTSAPVIYTKTVSPAKAIPDRRPRGVVDAMTVTDDLEIADLNFRVDNITHTFTGDLSVMMRAPSGYGTDFISVIGGVTDGGPGDNLINTVVDDTAAAPNDFLTATAAQAPFTDDFIPVFNSPTWDTIGFIPHDPVGELGRLNGTSTQGTWNILVSDQFTGDTGTLNGWSLIVTPRAFSCVAFTPVAAVSGTKTASGTFAQNGNVTYTVTLTNNGSGAQADNPGNEFTDVLPAALTLVSATATSGTAVANTGTNTVTWNGGLQLAGGSVTITIQATVKGDAGGLTVSNQGTISFDADLNGTNESSTVTDDPGTAAPNDPTVNFIACPTITLSPAALPSGTVAPYNQTITASGGTVPFSFTVTSGALPPGLTLNTNGNLSGTPTQAGNFSFTITATDARGCSGSQAYTLTITPSLSINDPSIIEGNSGAQDLFFTVTLNAPSNIPVRVSFSTANGSAVAPSDYQTNAGTLIFNPGETIKGFGVKVNGDSTFEPDETFTATLSNPVNAAITKSQGVGTITNDDEPSGGTLRFSQATYTVQENSTSVTITVTRTGATVSPVTVDYTTSDLTASSRSDYNTASGTLSFGGGETSKSFSVLINEDSYVEGTESLQLSLSNATGGAFIGSPNSATLDITDDVPESNGNPNDDAEQFVRQQYHDFLNREPDAQGLQFWVNQITECDSRPANEVQACRELRRINVSAAFFLSVEFQQTGFYVIRAQRVAFGSKSDTASSRITYQLFIRDAQQVGSGVVIGQSGADQQLEQNKQAYAQQIVTSAAFEARFATSLSAADYVDALYASAGVTPTAAERQAAINAFGGGGTSGRVAAFRRVVDSNSVQQAESNPSFVLMQYFGYLRRNPTDAPDGNDNGYQFWLAKLNQFNGNFVDADMVKAFITSAEYRQRFGQ